MNEEYLLDKPISEEQRQVWRRRKAELTAGLMKHTLTLDTAGIVGVTAIAGGFYSDSNLLWLLGVALLCFIVSMVCSYSALWECAIAMDESFESEAGGFPESVKIYLVASVGFVAGMMLTALFVWLNTFF